MKRKLHIVVVLDLTHQSGRDHLTGLYKYADDMPDWEMHLVPSTSAEHLQIAKDFLSRHVDGAIVKGESDSEIMRLIRRARMPLVVIDKLKDQPDSDFADVFICNDNKRIGRAAAAYFDSFGRFSTYGYVPVPGYDWSQQRGLAFISRVQARHGNAVASVATEPLDDWLLSLSKPAAVFAAFDEQASRVLERCRDLKLKVPGDICVLGVDDDALICDHTRPKLSSIRPDHQRQGYTAAKELHRILSTHVRGKGKTVICPHIGVTERESAAAIPPAVHLVSKAKSYISAHALEGITVANVVEHLGVSQRLANLRFSQATGHSIQHELIDLRLEAAKRLLRETEYPMHRIARHCGFKSEIVLAHLFSRHFGMSMRDFRNSPTTP